ncbi:hypothetical protein CSKR_202627 [Clonorchis sinensis]|uniref:Uncharacterized protein n=1 Tax=Clonorchis sinensis TaxID=79923 RepID=A0A8T1M1G8_CLOSI|nr:hypothetical protein CSKR_202627 [Clonorchis sinensis]
MNPEKMEVVKKCGLPVFSKLIASPNTGQSDRSSLASDVPSPVQHRRTLTNAAGASGHAQSSSTPIASAENQVVAIATLQDLMHVASIETEDMHAFFGLLPHQILDRATDPAWHRMYPPQCSTDEHLLMRLVLQAMHSQARRRSLLRKIRWLP